MERRNFIKYLAVTASTALGQTFFSFPSFATPNFEHSFTVCSMGTIVNITCSHCCRNKAEDAITYISEQLNRLEKLLSRFDTDGAVHSLNDQGKLVSPPKELYDVCIYSKKIYRISTGLFDPCVISPCHENWKENKIRPSYKDISVSKNLIRLPGRDSLVTFDGVAKGYIIDKISKYLIRLDIENHLVNAGGDIAAKGLASNGKPWVVAVNSPLGNSSKPFYLHNKAIATSGEYEQPVDAMGQGHIVNPKTGLSPHTMTSSSVIANSAMEADALSTAIFVLGLKQGYETISLNNKWACMFQTKDGAWCRSSNWPSWTV